MYEFKNIPCFSRRATAALHDKRIESCAARLLLHIGGKMPRYGTRKGLEGRVSVLCAARRKEWSGPLRRTRGTPQSPVRSPSCPAGRQASGCAQNELPGPGRSAILQALYGLYFPFFRRVPGSRIIRADSIPGL
jgi:hypothetical protein